MKNVLLGTLFVFNMAAFGQQGLVSSEPNTSKVHTVNDYKMPLKVEAVKESEKSGKKILASLTRMVLTISNEEFEKKKLTLN